MREKFIELASKRMTSAKQLAKSLLKFSTLAGTARALAIADNMTQARFELFPDEIVLKGAMENPDEYELINDLKGKPILINLPHRKGIAGLTPELFDDEKSLHLVSPCYLESLDVERVSIKCSEYALNRKEDGSYFYSCGGEISTGESGQACDESRYDVDDLGPLEFIEKLDDILPHY